MNDVLGTSIITENAAIDVNRMKLRKIFALSRHAHREIMESGTLGFFCRGRVSAGG